MNLVEIINKLSDESFDLFQNQDEYVVVDSDGNKLKSIKVDYEKKQIIIS